MILIGLMVLFIGYFIFLSFARHDNFYSRRLDLGNMDQTVWNVYHGNGFTLTDPMGEFTQPRLAIHADFLLILLAPLYALWSDPKMLLLVQVIVVALGAVPVYWIAKDKISSGWLALMFAACYLLYPPLNRNILHDFHAVTLSTTFFLYAFWYMEHRHDLLFLVYAVLAGLGKEDMWLTTGIMGLYIMVIQKRRIFGAAVFAVSALIFYYLFWFAIPAVRFGSEHFALSYLSSFGKSQNEILLNMLKNPLMVLGILFAPDRLLYYFTLLTPVGYLSLFTVWPVIFALPALLINVLSSNDLMRQIDYQYNSAIIPFILISSIYGYKTYTNIVHKFEKKYKELKKYSLSISWVIITLVLSTYLWGNLPSGRWSWFWTFITPPPEKTVMKQIADSIGPEYSVSVTNNIGAHFSQRRVLYNFPIAAESADWSVVYLGDPYAWPSGDAQQAAVERLLANPQYEEVASQSGFYAFRKK